MLFFLSRCSNPNAVLAIPAGTLRHRHPLTARRAAWRRSEGRRRRQRKRAQGRPGAGRRSKRAPLQSSTSNDVDDCVTRAGASRTLKRIASALRHRPALVDDRGRRRDRGASFTVAHRADTVKERMEDPRAGKGRRTCAPASRRRPRVFFRSSGRRLQKPRDPETWSARLDMRDAAPLAPRGTRGAGGSYWLVNAVRWIRGQRKRPLTTLPADGRLRF